MGDFKEIVWPEGLAAVTITVTGKDTGEEALVAGEYDRDTLQPFLDRVTKPTAALLEGHDPMSAISMLVTSLAMRALPETLLGGVGPVLEALGAKVTVGIPTSSTYADGVRTTVLPLLAVVQGVTEAEPLEVVTIVTRSVTNDMAAEVTEGL